MLASLGSFFVPNTGSQGKENRIPPLLSQEDTHDPSISTTATRTIANTVDATTANERASTMTLFPDDAIQALVHIVEGQSIPLDELVTVATNILNQHYLHYHHPGRGKDNNDSSINATTTDQATTAFSKDMVAAKLQLLATRNHWMRSISTSITKLAIKNSSNVAETKLATILSLLDSKRMYRWEVVTPSMDSYAVFFPDVNNRTNVKKARLARKKLVRFCTTLTKVLVILSDVELSLTKQQQGIDGTDKGKLWSRFRLEEEKIRKMDREYEANRIAEMVRTKKLETDRKQKQAQQQKKAEAMSARQKEKELKQQQMLQAKADAAQQQKILKEAAALSKKTTDRKSVV